MTMAVKLHIVSLQMLFVPNPMQQYINAEPLCCTPETNIILYINSNSILKNPNAGNTASIMEYVKSV